MGRCLCPSLCEEVSRSHASSVWRSDTQTGPCKQPQQHTHTKLIVLWRMMLLIALSITQTHTADQQLSESNYYGYTTWPQGHTHTHAHTTDIKILTSNRPMEVSLHWCGSIHTETPQKISSSSFFRYQLVNLLITATFWSAVWNKTSHFRSWNQFGIFLPNKWLQTINCLSELFLTNSIKWTNCLSSRFL